MIEIMVWVEKNESSCSILRSLDLDDIELVMSEAYLQKFYGQAVTSHGGKYRSHKHGLLEDILHIKLQRGVIILLEKDLEAVLAFLNESTKQKYR